MLHAMRWFGSQDPVSLHSLRQAGCIRVVTALLQLPVEAVWPTEEIAVRQQIVETDNGSYSELHWVVAESLHVHGDIRIACPAALST
jgi:mannonate dehydratase